MFYVRFITQFSFLPVTGTKGQQFDIKSMDTRDYQPMMCVFDVLMINDKVLSNKTLTERKEALKDVFNAIPGRIILSQCSKGKTKCVIVCALYFVLIIHL